MPLSPILTIHLQPGRKVRRHRLGLGEGQVKSKGGREKEGWGWGWQVVGGRGWVGVGGVGGGWGKENVPKREGGCLGHTAHAIMQQW